MDKADKDLLELVKRKCYVTDNSAEIISRLITLVEDSIKKVCQLIGTEEKKNLFLKPSLERELLLNYCYYVWNDKSIQEFISNYLDDIYFLQRLYLVKSKEVTENE